MEQYKENFNYKFIRVRGNAKKATDFWNVNKRYLEDSKQAC
jgi:hypothetical protein